MPPLRTIPVFQVDAFTSTPFTGNPAAVCLSEISLDETSKQRIAMEMNLSETAFVSPLGNLPYHEASRFLLQWFTPEVEVPLCGHATLATAAVLFHEMENSNETLHFHTKSGELRARKEGTKIVLDLPSETTVKFDPPERLLWALGVEAFDEVRYAERSKMLMVVLGNEGGEETLRALAPDFSALRSASADGDIEGVIVTAPASNGVHFVSRFFGPWLGIDEDPVTGAAHTVLGPYWSNRLGESQLRAEQVSARRGELDVLVKNEKRVELSGEAVILMKGKLYI